MEAGAAEPLVRRPQDEENLRITVNEERGQQQKRRRQREPEEDEEDPHNAWLYPHDTAFENDEACFRFVGILQCIVMISATALAFYTLGSQKHLRQDFPFLYWYIVATLTVDLAFWGVSAFVMLFLGLCVGDVGLAHSAALCGILHSTFQALIYYGSVGVGCWVLYEDAGFEKTPWTAVAYIALEVALSLVFSLRAFPVVWGLCGFICSRLYLVITRAPFVQFQQPDAPSVHTENVELAEFARSLATMENPTLPPGHQRFATSASRADPSVRTR